MNPDNKPLTHKETMDLAIEELAHPTLHCLLATFAHATTPRMQEYITRGLKTHQFSTPAVRAMALDLVFNQLGYKNLQAEHGQA